MPKKIVWKHPHEYERPASLFRWAQSLEQKAPAILAGDPVPDSSGFGSLSNSAGDG
ncbi:hypothetical protein JCM17846_04390 [Iodidimonas nitroreducens]|uniref:Uncharacterized protein n=1 Tax=Iodidimonas nitroreducens TaxID=1236968 RepID=A0A5A7N429_9PROT|nr:hypothetical protein JCM17846_04390 [Iodidimonas nitroreducens]